MKQVLMFLVLLISQPVIVSGQESQLPSTGTTKLPREFSLWYYPDSFNGRRGLKFDVFEIATTQDGTVTGKATMHGRGLDSCTIRNQPVIGKVENKTLLLRTDVKENDNLTCRTTYELKLGDGGIPEGGIYKGASSNGSMKLN